MPFHDVSSSGSVFNVSADLIVNTSVDDESLTPSNTNIGSENRQLQPSPTHTMSTSSTIIDHIYVFNDLTHSWGTNLPSLFGSDRNILQISITNHHAPHSRRSSSKVWLYKQADFDTANTTLQCLPTSIYSKDDVNTFWAEWSDVFMTDTILTKEIKPKTKVPDLTDELLHLIRKKCRLYNHAKRVGTARAWSK